MNSAGSVLFMTTFAIDQDAVTASIRMSSWCEQVGRCVEFGDGGLGVSQVAGGERRSREHPPGCADVQERTG